MQKLQGKDIDAYAITCHHCDLQIVQTSTQSITRYGARSILCRSKFGQVVTKGNMPRTRDEVLVSTSPSRDGLKT